MTGPKAPAQKAKKAEEPPKTAPPSHLRQWITLLFVMSALFAVYSVTRDILYRRLVYGLAQRTLNVFACASVENMGAVDISAEGNIVIRDAVVTTLHRGRKRVFYRAERIEVALDGSPLRRDPVYVSRVDLFRPEMWVVRETDGDWNVVWALQPAPQPVEAAPAPEPPGPTAGPPPAHPPRGGWPRNGVHVHHGLLHVTFEREDGSELTWDIANVNTVISRAEPGICFGPMRGDFYGGRMNARATIPSYSPFRMDLEVDVRGADAARLAAGRPFITRPLSGRVDGVLALKSDMDKIGWRPICAGRIEVNDGDLWDLPPFIGVLATLALTEVGDRKLTAAHLEFTVDRDRVRIDQMDFLGRPLCLFGDGSMDLTGDKLDVVLVPRLGKSMDDILPLVGLPIQWLLDVAKGALVPIRITGAIWAPQFVVGGSVINEPVKKLIQEKSPK